ncbi:uncharacterized protein LOC107042386 [Diachasma alloeum]|uniref:uncharacterized protein LOC107042386 n=1 Tax=Diachasma alloeum TaxID=454923 RepID=UPI00073810D1|nr:uncharacterized protein LOC107042386 [Diachasma alloeum]
MVNLDDGHRRCSDASPEISMPQAKTRDPSPDVMNSALRSGRSFHLDDCAISLDDEKDNVSEFSRAPMHYDMEDDQSDVDPSVSKRSSPQTFLAAAAVMQPKLVARPFNPDRPQLWFAQLETQFTDLGIVTKIDKYNKTVPLIDTVYAAEVEDLIIARPVNTPYQTLKNELIRCFTTSRSMNLLRLLDNENLGDRTPSKHLRHLKALVPGVDEEVLKTHWLSHLPEQTRATLTAQVDASLENLAKLADRVHEVFQPHQTSANSASSGNVVNSALRDELESLKATVAAMQLRESRSRSRGPPKCLPGCRSTKAQYLVDTGSDVSVCPRRVHTRKRDASGYQLFAANNTLINTYGYIPILLDLGLRKEIKWRFVEAGQLQDGQLVKFESFSVRLQTIEEDSSYVALLKKFPAIIKPEGLLRNIKHMTQHHIRTTHGPPVSARPRRLLPNKLAIAKAKFSNMQKLGIARRGQGPWSSPLHLAPENNGEWKPCGDYRGLNDRTIPDKYPVRYLEDFAANLYGSTIFLTIDLVKAFNQVPVAAEDIQKTAIITPFGLFEFPFMTFGLRNAAQTFQRLIDEVTRDLPFLFPYIDDILVASETPEQHLDHLRQLFQRLEYFGLVVNVAKSVLGKPAVVFLGHTINAQGIKPPADRVRAILEYPKPSNVKSLRRFLGALNFYRKFMKGAAEILAPLNAAHRGPAVKGKHPVDWTPEMEAAFDASKRALAEATHLSHPNVHAEWAVFTDASDHAIGAVLQQRHQDGWQPLAFFSKKLALSERHHATYDRELEAIYEKPDKATPWQCRRLDFIGQFTSDIVHVAGDDNVVADALSRIEAVFQAIDSQQLAQSQREDPELRQLLEGNNNNSLNLQLFRFPGSDIRLYCDVSASGTIRPQVYTVSRGGATTGHQDRNSSSCTSLSLDRKVWSTSQDHIRQRRPVYRGHLPTSDRDVGNLTQAYYANSSPG